MSKVKGNTYKGLDGQQKLLNNTLKSSDNPEFVQFTTTHQTTKMVDFPIQCKRNRLVNCFKSCS